MPVPVVYVLWAALSASILIAILRQRVVWAALAMPVLLTFLLGQVDVVMMALYAALRSGVGAGIALAFLVLKPQLVLLLAPWMLWQWWRTDRQQLVGFVLVPSFVSEWQGAMLSKVGGVSARMPTVWGIAAEFFSATPVATLSACALIVLVAVLSVWLVARWRASILELTSALLIGSVIVSPYLWNYDQVVLIAPRMVALVRLDQRTRNGLIVAGLLFALDALAFGLLVVASARVADTFSIALPLLIGGLIWWVYQASPTREVVD